MTYITETIGSLLKTKLDGVAELQAVYDGEVSELLKFPSATLTFMGFDDEIYDTAANVRVFHYLVRVYTKARDRIQAEADMRRVVGAIVESIEGDPTLAGNALYTVCPRADSEARTREMEVWFMNIQVDVAVRQNR